MTPCLEFVPIAALKEILPFIHGRIHRFHLTISDLERDLLVDTTCDQLAAKLAGTSARHEDWVALGKTIARRRLMDFVKRPSVACQLSAVHEATCLPTVESAEDRALALERRLCQQSEFHMRRQALYAVTSPGTVERLVVSTFLEAGMDFALHGVPARSLRSVGRELGFGREQGAAEIWADAQVRAAEWSLKHGCELDPLDRAGAADRGTRGCI